LIRRTALETGKHGFGMGQYIRAMRDGQALWTTWWHHDMLEIFAYQGREGAEKDFGSG